MFAGVDYYGLDELYSDEERLARDTIRGFVEQQVMPIIGRHFRDGTFPADIIQKLGRLGALGANLKGYGCAGMNAVAYGLIIQELERGDSGIRSFASVQGSLVMYPIWAYGSEVHKERWLPRMARGEAVGCFGLTEPDFGSNPAGLRTSARRRGDQWILNGTKRWITNGGIADVAVVWAKTEDGVIRGFLVERGARGFSTTDIHGKFSLRASVTSELVFEDCEVPADAVLPGVEGLKGPLGCLNQARYGIAWGAIGAAMACYDEALRYAKERVQFARPIAGYQLVQAKLVEMLTEITKMQLVCLRLGRLKDAGKVRPQQVSLAKRNNVYWALRIARTARDILGASGITDEYQCGRHMCNLESVYTYEGTHDIHTLILGQDITGLSAFE
ncbi:MAG TPA: acyl-CoA dehydrogenase family protein [Polyangia bacterium]|nr:acyl-CoA dehydrogenase family protein [Polyangia bacterium]